MINNIQLQTFILLIDRLAYNMDKNDELNKKSIANTQNHTADTDLLSN